MYIHTGSLPSVSWNPLNLKCKTLKHVVCKKCAKKVHYKMVKWDAATFTVWFKCYQVLSMMTLKWHAMSNAWPLVKASRYLQLKTSSQRICSIDPGTHAYLLQFFWGISNSLAESFFTPIIMVLPWIQESSNFPCLHFPTAKALLLFQLLHISSRTFGWSNTHQYCSFSEVNSFLTILCELLGMVI